MGFLFYIFYRSVRFVHLFSRETFMQLPNGTKAILFDMDGVIFNSEDLAHDVFLGLSIKYKSDFLEDDHKAILGTAESYWSQYFVTKWKLSMSDKEFSTLFWDLLSVERDKRLEFMPGFEKLIGQIRGIGLKTALVTSTPRPVLTLMNIKFNVKSLFDVIVTGDEVSSGKPDLEPYLLAVRRLEMEPNECIVIEDAISGVKSGKAAGCYVIAVPTVHAKGLDYSEADRMVSDLEEVSKIIAQIA